MQETTTAGADGAGTSTQDLRELARLADALVEQVGEARQRFDHLQTVLDGSATADVSEIPTDVDTQVVELEDPEALGERIRLDALNMALTGNTRDETREHLFESFPDVAPIDVEDVLDITFGAEADGSDGLGPRKRRFGRLRR